MSVDDFFTRLNPLLVALLRSPLHGLASRGLLLLGFTGRRSGRRFTIPVGYQRDGDELTVMASEAPKKSWWRNFHETGPVTLRLRGEERTGNATLVPPDSDDFAFRAERTLRRVPAMARVWGVRFDRSRGLAPEELERLRREIAAVRIELT